ncbi:MAG: hypothetical protein ACR2O6_13825, partial [Ilumatobacteraceae bacterium]
FPSVSTINQFFDDEKFQNYRLLGFEAGEAVVEGRTALRARLAAHVDRAGFVSSVELDLGDPDRRDSVSWSESEIARLIGSDDEYEQVRRAILAPSPVAAQSGFAGDAAADGDPR